MERRLRTGRKCAALGATLLWCLGLHLLPLAHNLDHRPDHSHGPGGHAHRPGRSVPPPDHSPDRRHQEPLHSHSHSHPHPHPHSHSRSHSHAHPHGQHDSRSHPAASAGERRPPAAAAAEAPLPEARASTPPAPAEVPAPWSGDDPEHGKGSILHFAAALLASLDVVLPAPGPALAAPGDGRPVAPPVRRPHLVPARGPPLSNA